MSGRGGTGDARRLGWASTVILLGLSGVGIALRVHAGAWPSGALIGAALGIPLLALGTAFVGLARSGSVIGWAVVSLTAVVAPVVDMATGDFDAAAFGLASSIAIAAAGGLAIVAMEARRLRTRT